MIPEISQSRDLGLFNSLANDPSIYDKVKDDTSPEVGQFSLASAMGNPENVFLRVNARDELAESPTVIAGGFCFVYRGYGIYEVHTMLLPKFRGKFAIIAGRLVMEWMFTRTNALTLTSFARADCPEAEVFATLSGFKKDGVRPWRKSIGGAPMETTYLSLTIREWIRQSWPWFSPRGEHFHLQLFAQLGGPLHAEDSNHDGIVGMALSMLVGGQPAKAEIFYNEWAACAGYMPAKFLQVRDGVSAININEAVIEIDRDYKVTLLQKLGD